MTNVRPLRALATVVALLCLLAAPVRAETTGVIIVQGSTYVPGDSTGLVVVPATHLRGNDLAFRNLDPLNAHSVTSEAFVPGTNDTVRLFDSEPQGFNRAVVVPGVPALAPGRYTFFCSIHGGMQGVLDVIG